QARGTVDAMPHLTCVGALKEDIASIADEYYELGIRKIMALRGDPQGGAGAAYVPTEGGFPYAEQLVEGLAAQHDFDIYVAAYPETHPDAPSPHFDLQNLKRKFDAGASKAITQYFFNTESYLRFRDAAVRMGIDNPIIPGILPVTNFATLQRFSKASSIALPKWLETAFAGLDAEPETRQLIAANIAIEQVIALQAEGVNDFHFYTLNRAELCYAVCHALGVRRALTNENNTVEAAA
ncbi:MAG: methylenetetrahydrofolate reductase [NAD(P)H], partial [Betaproteobacteria bacterium]|nr:methylenetetrahydrofolate reductase [NAD(P)H] [Betaproteobacteria bacterium]